MVGTDRAPAALDDSVRLVERLSIEVGKGAVIVALVSGHTLWKFGFTIPLVMVLFEGLRKFLERFNGD